MYAVFSIEVSQGGAEWYETMWAGKEEATEKELELEIIGLLQGFYDDAKTEDNWNPLGATYTTDDTSYSLNGLYYKKSKEEVSQWLLDRLEYSY